MIDEVSTIACWVGRVYARHEKLGDMTDEVSTVAYWIGYVYMHQSGIMNRCERN